MSVMMITSAVVLLLMCTAYMVYEYYSFKEIEEKNISILGSVIAANSSAALAFDSPKDANEILNALKTNPHIVSACLYDEDGKIFSTYPLNKTRSTFPQAVLGNGYSFYDNYLEGFQPVMQNEKQLGTLYIKSDLDSMHDQLRHFALIGLILIAGALIIAYLLSNILQKTISQPILELEQLAKVVSMKRDFSVRAHKQGNDEVGALTDAFNQMLAQIETQNQEITTFNLQLENKVTERTLALQQQRDFVETIINSSVDLVAVFDKDLNYIMLNKHADDFYSIKRSEIIGKNILDVFPQTKESGMYSDLKKALNGETVHNLRYKSLILNRYFESFYIPLKDSKNNIYGVLTIAHDITQIMEASEKLEKINDELIKSNRDLEQFAYVASHDLQEPLRKIQTFTQLLGDNFNSKEQLHKYQEKIGMAALRMQNLIQDVLNFSRISKSEDAFVDNDLNAILDSLKVDYELLIRERNVTIINSTLPVIKGITLQLSQLFSNLINNSIKYSSKDPVIEITANKLSETEIKSFIALNPDKSYYKIVFKDNGIGFEPKFSEQIFNIFQRLHGKQTYSGTGIGLALCKKIVENHHGIIYAEGEPGIGATFSIILPA